MDLPGGEFVLEPLLQRQELDTETKSAVVNLAIQWLSRHKDDERAMLAIIALLRTSDLQPSQLEIAQRLALSWCHSHRQEVFSSAALLHIFDRIRRTEDRSTSVEILLELVNLAVWWLQQHESSELFGPVFVGFVWSGLFPPAAAIHLMEPAFRWLLSSREKADIEIRTIKGILEHCVKIVSSDDQATMRHACEHIVESLPEREPGERLMAELGLLASYPPCLAT